MTDTPAAPTPASTAPTVAELTAGLDGLMTSDSLRFGRRLAGLHRISDKGKQARALADLQTQVERARSKVERRTRTVPDIRFPPELPVSERADDLAEAIRNHQVVIVAGETGSGKSTQLPKICLSIGRG